MGQRRAGGEAGTGRQRRAYTIRDQVGLRRLEGFAVSPDGGRVILQIATAASGRNRLDTHLWSVDARGGPVRRVTRSGSRNSSPLFAPDGRSIYYLAGRRSGQRQVVCLSLEGGVPRQVTRSPIDIESFVLSRDGTQVAFSAMVYPGGPDSLASTADQLQAEAKRLATGHIHDRLFIRHWDQWKTGRRSHLFVQSVDGGPAVDVMAAMDADAPSHPFGGREQYSFTPDGSGIVFTARDAGPEEAWSTDLDLFLTPVDASSPPRNLTPENPATDTDPAFSPDGTFLAWLAMDRAGYEADKQTVILRGWPDGMARRLTDDWALSAEAIEWSADGRTLHVIAQDNGQRALFAIDIRTGAITPLVAQGHVGQTMAVGDAVFYSHESLVAPADLYSLVDGQPRRVTRLNATRMRGLAIGETSRWPHADVLRDDVGTFLDRARLVMLPHRAEQFGIGAAVAQYVVAARFDLVDDVRVVMADAAVQKHRRGQLQLVQDLEQAPVADPIAVVAPGEISRVLLPAAIGQDHPMPVPNAKCSILRAM